MREGCARDSTPGLYSGIAEGRVVGWLQRLLRCSLRLVARSIIKNVKDKAGRNFSETGSVIIISYGLAPPIPQYPR